MRAKEYFRDFVVATVEAGEAEGLDLSSDNMCMNFTYPDMPHILVSIQIGGMFLNQSSDMEFEEELH